ncbi:MAG: cysteine--tRNA ligase [Planctomycetes bacterium]|nr:cysteine--tRNA ligase [Planctomycetota bacterium]
MALYLYNTYNKRKEEFKPGESGKARVYSCGPTVYSHPHIGNFRSFIAADILCRYLRYQGYEVTQIMNITDVGHLTTDDNLAPDEEGVDKIQLAAQSEKKSPKEITEFYANKFFELSKLLNLYPASHYPKATQHIPEMIVITKRLLEKGYAYEVNGNIYYDISKFPDYGRLSGNTLENLKAGARVSIKSEKRSPMDFALWKHDPKHLMQWDSPWGRGFPGWHLECSAMALKYLGEKIDIHTGGEDNIFPHHECEIAQSEAFTGSKVIKYWVHARHLLVDNQKMSKSLGNFYTVDDILKQGYHPMILRYALMSSHYGQQLNFNMDLLKASKGAIERLINFQRMLDAPIREGRPAGIISNGVSLLIGNTRKRFEAAMDDNLNISEALAAIFDLITAVNKLAVSAADAVAIKSALEDFDKVLGILGVVRESDSDEEIEKLVIERTLARKESNFKRADEIRKYLEDKGIILEDTPRGTKWHRHL